MWRWAYRLAYVVLGRILMGRMGGVSFLPLILAFLVALGCLALFLPASPEPPPGWAPKAWSTADAAAWRTGNPGGDRAVIVSAQRKTRSRPPVLRNAAVLVTLGACWLALPAGPASAHDCSGLSDCFSGNVVPAILLLLGLLLLFAGAWYLAPLLGRFAISVAMRQMLAAGLRSRLGHAADRALSRSASRSITFTTKSLQHVFKHAKDFGISGNWSRAGGEAFRNAVQAHLRNPNTLARQGWYHGQRVTHFYNPKTGLNVIRTAKGELLSGWKLSPRQAWHLLRTGRLGGG